MQKQNVKDLVEKSDYFLFIAVNKDDTFNFELTPTNPEMLQRIEAIASTVIQMAQKS